MRGKRKWESEKMIKERGGKARVESETLEDTEKNSDTIRFHRQELRNQEGSRSSISPGKKGSKVSH